MCVLILLTPRCMCVFGVALGPCPLVSLPAVQLLHSLAFWLLDSSPLLLSSSFDHDKFEMSPALHRAHERNGHKWLLGLFAPVKPPRCSLIDDPGRVRV